MSIYTAPTTQSSDDAREVGGGTVTLDATTINTAGSGVWLGVRYQTSAIDDAGLDGCTVDSAYLTFRTTAADDPDLDIYGHDHDNAPTFTTTNNDISGRTTTTAKVNWTATDVGANTTVNSPDLKTIIQEIIDRPGWSPGNAIALLLDSLSASSIAIHTYDYDGSTRRPTLTINYTPAATTSPPKPKTARIRLTTRVGGILTS